MTTLFHKTPAGFFEIPIKPVSSGSGGPSSSSSHPVFHAATDPADQALRPLISELHRVWMETKKLEKTVQPNSPEACTLVAKYSSGIKGLMKDALARRLIADHTDLADGLTVFAAVWQLSHFVLLGLEPRYALPGLLAKWLEKF